MNAIETVEITTVLLNILQAVLIAAVPLIVNYIRLFFSAKSLELQNRIENDNIRTIIANTDKLVGEVVSYVGQTYVDNLKEGGAFNVEEQQEALRMAYERALSMIDSKSADVIKSVFGDLDKYILTLIEDATDRRNDAKRASDNGMY